MAAGRRGPPATAPGSGAPGRPSSPSCGPRALLQGAGGRPGAWAQQRRGPFCQGRVGAQEEGPRLFVAPQPPTWEVLISFFFKGKRSFTEPQPGQQNVPTRQSLQVPRSSHLARGLPARERPGGVGAWPHAHTHPSEGGRPRALCTAVLLCTCALSQKRQGQPLCCALRPRCPLSNSLGPEGRTWAHSPFPKA